LLRVIEEGSGVALSRDYDDGNGLFQLAIAHGLEGVIGKRRGSVYTEGRSRDWIKLKVAGAFERQNVYNC